MNEETKYEEALAQLETIVRKMEQNEFDIDEPSLFAEDITGTRR